MRASVLRRPARPLVLAALLVAAGCSRDATSPGAVDPPVEPAARTPSVIWNDAMLEAVRRSTLPPTVVARALAAMNTAMYDAWA